MCTNSLWKAAWLEKKKKAEEDFVSETSIFMGGEYILRKWKTMWKKPEEKA